MLGFLGSELLDRYVPSALRLAQPFAELPSHIPSPSLPASGAFRFRVSEAAAAR